MENEIVKKLTSKSNSDFEFAASHMINNSDVDAFNALIQKGDFLFDFVKENVKKRLEKAVTEDNFKNLFSFLKFYSQSYEDLIISAFVKYADEDITDKMLDILENGCDEEKTYAAKYFSYINDPLCLDLLKKLYFSNFEPLSYNSAETLGIMQEKSSLEDAYQKLNSKDDFEVISAVRFLIGYHSENSLEKIFETMRNSSLSENIAAEIPYIKSFSQLLDNEKYTDNTLLAINNILNGFGDIIPLAQVFDFEFYDIFEKLSRKTDPKSATTMLNAKLKFEQLTENDEYLFDEDKNTKQEIKEISNFLNSLSKEYWEEQQNEIKDEINNESDFKYIVLQIIQEMKLEQHLKELKNLIKSSNQTTALKTIEVIKSLNKIDEVDLASVLSNISDDNIKEMVKSLF